MLRPHLRREFLGVADRQEVVHRNGDATGVGQIAITVIRRDDKDLGDRSRALPERVRGYG